MRWIIAFLVALGRVLLPALANFTRPRASDAKAQPALRDRLRRRIWRAWPAMVLAVALLAAPGCASRTVYVPEGEPVRIRKSVRRAKVWILGPDGEPVAGEMDLPEGWYCLPDDGDEEREGPVGAGAAGQVVIEEPVSVSVSVGGRVIRLRLVPGTRVVFPDGIVPDSNSSLGKEVGESLL